MKYSFRVIHKEFCINNYLRISKLTATMYSNEYNGDYVQSTSNKRVCKLAFTDQRLAHVYSLSRRLDKARLGNLGDVKSLSGGLYEMREHFGAGWRMYFLKQENLIILMLGAGDKSTQPADIKNIRQIIKRLEE